MMDDNVTFDIPFESLSDDFFFKRGRCYMTNASRKKSRKNRQILNENGLSVTKFPIPSETSESFTAALEHLDRKLRSCDSQKKRSVIGCAAVLKHLKETSPVIAVQDLVKVYQN